MPPGRTQTVVFNGQRLQLDQSQMRRLQRHLISEVRLRVWMPVRNTFDNAYAQYRWHEQQARFPFFHWILEAAGGAGSLPDARIVSRLKQERDQLDRRVQPNGVLRFFNDLPGFVRRSSEFRRNLWRYTSRWETGGRRVVRVLTITRDQSVTVLSGLATLYTGGGSAVGGAMLRATGSRAAAALAEGAATNFLLGQMERAVSRMGRILAGEQVSPRETLDNLAPAAIQSVSDAALGEIVGRIMGPIQDLMAAQVERELARGNLLRGVTLDYARGQLQSMLAEAIQDFTRRRASDTRRVLSSLRGNENEQAAARAVCDGLMANRNFRQALEQRLRQEANA